jgi:hypothetical protein
MRKQAVLLLLLAAGCDLSSTEPETRNSANQLELRAEWQASIGSMNGSAVTGLAHLMEYRAYYEAEITVSGGPPSDSLVWRIYPGTCANSDDDEFGNSTQAFPTLRTDASGSANLTRLLAGALDSLADYNVRVQTDGDIDNTVGCGDLERQ